MRVTRPSKRPCSHRAATHVATRYTKSPRRVHRHTQVANGAGVDRIELLETDTKQRHRRAVIMGDVTFDENNRVRVLAQDKYDKTLALADSATEFCTKVSQLNDIVKETVESVDRQAARTEREKLRAVGKRNQVAADAEQRRRKKAELASLRLEKQAELDRLQAEYDSLLRVRQEQEALIAKLSDSSS